MGKTTTATIKSPTRKLGVDMNLSGAWRSLGTFDLDKADIDAVLDAAETIVLNQTNRATGKLRITDAAQTPPMVLQYWTRDKGWEDSRHVAG